MFGNLGAFTLLVYIGNGNININVTLRSFNIITSRESNYTAIMGLSESGSQTLIQMGINL